MKLSEFYCCFREEASGLYMCICHASEEPIFLTPVGLTGILYQHADVSNLLAFCYLFKKILLAQYE